MSAPKGFERVSRLLPLRVRARDVDNQESLSKPFGPAA
jgi:hypothetical protein